MKLDVLVRKYISMIRPIAQDELNWFRSQPNLKEAVKCAGLAINRKGKRYFHQRKIIREALPQAESILSAHLKSIKKCTDFDELYNLIDTLLEHVDGIGELYIYDTSLRIGAKLNCLPSKVYLHAGVREGAKAIGFNGKLKYVELSDLPKELQELEPHEIEDVLCIFKDKLKQIKIDVADEEILRRSWCK